MPPDSRPGPDPRTEPEAYLSGLLPIGWRLGLERMEALVEELDQPQRRFRSVHLVGTNGKTSVARMVEALLEAHGTPAGACVSPHMNRWSERVTVRGRPVGESAFAAAVGRVADAAARVESRAGQGPGAGPGGLLEVGERITQFEIATAVAFVVLAEAGVEVGLVEAGLGGRLDATNVIPSELTVLTSIGLDHTEWLGETETAIAAEKLAVLRPGTALLLGQVPDPVRELAERTATERRSRLIAADPALGRRDGSYQHGNFALAVTAAAEVMGGGDLDPGKVAEVAAGIHVPGRLEWLPGEPSRLLDVAHNPAGAAALAAALPEVAADRPVVGCVAILAEKDAAAFAEALAPALAAVVCTELPVEALRASGRPGAGSRPATDLAACFVGGVRAAEAVAEPDAALRRAGEIAAQQHGVVLVTGSHYLVAMARESSL